MTDNKLLSAESPVQERHWEIIRLLHEAYPDAQCELDHDGPLELLIATILSAQCTDVRVNKVTPTLFSKYPTAIAFAEAELEELEQDVRSTGFYRNKAKNIQGTCRRLLEEYGAEVPAEMNALLTLPGVARKTANVVLGNAYNIADGIVVDTHVKRLSNRLGLTNESSPVKIERVLMNLTPQEEWVDLSHLLIFHGRRVCSARRPNCPGCSIRHLCPSSTL